jgi:hypothetical protein
VREFCIGYIFYLVKKLEACSIILNLDSKKIQLFYTSTCRFLSPCVVLLSRAGTTTTAHTCLGAHTCALPNTVATYQRHRIRIPHLASECCSTRLAKYARLNDVLEQNIALISVPNRFWKVDIVYLWKHRVRLSEAWMMSHLLLIL